MNIFLRLGDRIRYKQRVSIEYPHYKGYHTESMAAFQDSWILKFVKAN